MNEQLETAALKIQEMAEENARLKSANEQLTEELATTKEKLMEQHNLNPITAVKHLTVRLCETLSEVAEIQVFWFSCCSFILSCSTTYLGRILRHGPQSNHVSFFRR